MLFLGDVYLVCILRLLTQLWHISAAVLSWFMISIDSRGAHESEEQ
jgi:hypothetical protein